MFPWGTKCSKKSWGAKIKFVGEAFNVVGMWEKVKTVGELEKSWGSSKTSWGSHFMGAVTEGCKSLRDVKDFH